MHALVRTAVVAALFGFAATAAAKDQQAGKNAPAPADKPAATAQHDAAQHSAAAKSDEQSDQSRFRKHNGRWWYWTPKNQWVVWHNNTWVPYRAGMFGATTANRAGRRYSYAPGEQAGPVQQSYYPRIYRAPRSYGANRSIRYAGSKINADYAPYTGGSMQ